LFTSGGLGLGLKNLVLFTSLAAAAVIMAVVENRSVLTKTMLFSPMSLSLRPQNHLLLCQKSLVDLHFIGLFLAIQKGSIELVYGRDRLFNRFLIL